MTGEFAIAVHAIVYLNHKAATLSSEALAENVCTNPARVRKVMAKLKQSDLIETKEGAVGGYRFTLDPEKVTLLQILDALEQPVITVSWRSGDPSMECLVASGMGAIMDGIYADMDACCRKKLEEITIASVDRQIFQH